MPVSQLSCAPARRGAAARRRSPGGTRRRRGGSVPRGSRRCRRARGARAAGGGCAWDSSRSGQGRTRALCATTRSRPRWALCVRHDRPRGWIRAAPRPPDRPRPQRGGVSPLAPLARTRVSPYARERLCARFRPTCWRGWRNYTTSCAPCPAPPCRACPFPARVCRAGCNGPATGLQRACNGPATGLQRACNGPATGLQRACNGPATAARGQVFTDSVAAVEAALADSDAWREVPPAPAPYAACPISTG
jgi:hypothetical protein